MMHHFAAFLPDGGFFSLPSVSRTTKFLPPLLLVALTAIAGAKEPVDARVEPLLARMTRAEKIGQLQLVAIEGKDLQPYLAPMRAGGIGAVLNSPGPEESRRLQHIATTESRLGIPLLFGRDVIHGFRTIFPIPLALAASWDPQVMESAARVSAIEARSEGVNWTFAPMLDVTRDPRWGRVAESPGEDPYLGSVFARAMVRGFQGDRLDSPTSLAACVKHFAGYGASEGGRDYNTTWIPDQQLHEVYLPSYKAGVEAGAATVMTAFNNLNGIPCPASTGLFRDLLREQWKFDGFVVSDWGSLSQLLTEGLAADGPAAAKLAASAGVNMEMVTEIYRDHLAALLDAGTIKTDVLDGMVREILSVKFRMGLFEPLPQKPYAYPPLLAPEHLDAAKSAAIASTVLLKNDNATLPLADSVKTIAVVGPLADSGADQIGTWSMDGLGSDAITPLTALRGIATSKGLKILHAPGLAISRTTSREGFDAALAAARSADVTLLFVGEEAILSGEAHCRASLDLPGAQPELIREITALGKPVVLIVMAGRPLVFGDLLDHTAAVLFAWHPGTMAGPALTDILFGAAEPTGRLPITFPKAVGQIPIYYAHRNTGRPFNPATFVPMDKIPVGAPQSSLGNESHYLDLGHDPAFPFGFGLGYTTFALSGLKLDATEIAAGATTKVRATLENSGKRRGTAVIQLYIHDRVAGITRPLKELKGWSRVSLDPGKTQELSFDLSPAQLSYPNAKGEPQLEPGMFDIYLGTSSATTESVPLTVTGDAPKQAGPPVSSQIQPASGVTGYALQSEFQFGTAAGNNVKSITDLQAGFTPDAPWGRINHELQRFVNFLPVAWHGVRPDPEAAKRTHQFEEEALVLNSNHLGGKYSYGTIESGGIVTNATVKYPVIVEVLAKLPKGRAHWPSIWMYDYHSDKHGSEEIDIMESQFNAPVGQRDSRNHVYQNTHGKFTMVENFLLDKSNRFDAGVDLSEDYHYYSCHWLENGDVDMYVDGKKTVRRNIPWLEAGDPNIIIMLSTGSEKLDWPGPIIDDSKNGTDTFTPDDPNSTFKIRHLRIFKPAANPSPKLKEVTVGAIDSK